MPRDRTAALEACPAACLNVMLMASSACANRVRSHAGAEWRRFPQGPDRSWPVGLPQWRSRAWLQAMRRTNAHTPPEARPARRRCHSSAGTDCDPAAAGGARPELTFGGQTRPSAIARLALGPAQCFLSLRSTSHRLGPLAFRHVTLFPAAMAAEQQQGAQAAP
jgi:hypothetical protein